MNRDIVLGAAGIAAAAAYWRAADVLPVSLLADEVGADGVPKALAACLGALSLLMLVRALAPRPVAIGGVENRGAAPHLWAAGVVGLAALYALAAPWLGYVPALALLIAATAVLFGMRPHPRLALVAAGGAVLFWVLFAKFLSVSMPPGFWPRLWG